MCLTQLPVYDLSLVAPCLWLELDSTMQHRAVVPAAFHHCPTDVLSHQKRVLIPPHTYFLPQAQELATAYFIEIQPLLLVALRISLSFCYSYLISEILNHSLGKKKKNKNPFSMRLGIQGLKQKQFN